MGNYKNYEPIFPYLDTENFTYIFIDLRGYGLSKEIDGVYSCKEASNDVLNLIKELDLKNVFLVAHSMSTMIAQHIALLDKDIQNIKSLILVTPIPASGIKMSEKSKQTLLDDMKKNDGNIEEIVYSASKRHNEAWAKNRIKMAYNASIVKARVGYMNMYLNTDFEQEARDIKIPIKIIVGKYDFPIFAIKQVKRKFESTYENLEIVECQEAGHYPMLECPVFFASKLEEFCK
jgi:pimeloyl-ACP methyl ester carboxylesterase